jgi:hypothetical protein
MKSSHIQFPPASVMKPGSGVPRGGHQLERELLAFLNPSKKKGTRNGHLNIAIEILENHHVLIGQSAYTCQNVPDIFVTEGFEGYLGQLFPGETIQVWGQVLVLVYPTLVMEWRESCGEFLSRNRAIAWPWYGLMGHLDISFSTSMTLRPIGKNACGHVGFLQEIHGQGA